MKRFCEITFIFLLLFMISSCAVNTIYDDLIAYDFSGYVYGDRNGDNKREPLSGIKLYFEGGSETVTTDAKGYFCFEERLGACGVLKITDPNEPAVFKSKSVDIDLLRMTSVTITLDRK